MGGNFSSTGTPPVCSEARIVRARRRGRGGGGRELCMPWVASRRRSCATTRCTAARSASGPRGQRAVEVGQRPLGRQRCGALDLRALELAPQQRLEAAQRVARQRRHGAGRPPAAPAAARRAGRARAGSAARRRRARPSPPGGARTPRSRAARGRASRPPSRPRAPRRSARAARRDRRRAHRRRARRLQRLADLLARAPRPRRRGRRSGRTRARRRGGPPGTWRASPRAPRGSRCCERPVDLAQRRERVEQLGGADRDALRGADPRRTRGAARREGRRGVPVSHIGGRTAA